MRTSHEVADKIVRKLFYNLAELSPDLFLLTRQEKELKLLQIRKKASTGSHRSGEKAMENPATGELGDWVGEIGVVVVLKAESFPVGIQITPTRAVLLLMAGLWVVMVEKE